MMKKRSKIQKHLAKMVIAALLCTGVGHCLISPAVVEAASEVTVTDIDSAISNEILQQTGYTVYYGKYFYSHTGSDSTYLNGANETANFDAVNSHRIRLGARLTHALNEKNKLYGGLAWQYEFKGDARALTA